jgi:hypothetical protein
MGSDLGSEVSIPALSRHMNGWSLRETFSAGEAVEDLAAHPGWKVIDALLQAEVDTVDKRLDADRVVPPSRAEYAAAHGRRGGLLAARAAVGTVLTRYREKLAEQQGKHEAVEPLALAADRG